MLEIGERPWGKYYVLADEPHYKLKRIEVNPGQKLSYQYHHKRQEQWTIIEGNATIVLDDKRSVYLTVKVFLYLLVRNTE
jgi:mannose-6-phosphate isomerase